MTRYRWVAAREAEGFLIKGACGVTAVSRQVFRAWRRRDRCTSIVNVHWDQLLEIVPGRDADGTIAWLLTSPPNASP